MDHLTFETRAASTLDATWRLSSMLQIVSHFVCPVPTAVHGFGHKMVF